MNQSQNPVEAGASRTPLGHFLRSAGPSAALERIRALDLNNPAPFGCQPIRKAQEEHRAGGGRSLCLQDVPISRIAGIANTNQLSNWEQGGTFRDALFAGLHGASITEESIAYLCSDAIKSSADGDGRAIEGFVPFPQRSEGLQGAEKARGDIQLVLRGQEFFAVQGQQRVIVARFAIFHTFGLGGLLRNVRVYEEF